jgi:hypothetical protein
MSEDIRASLISLISFTARKTVTTPARTINTKAMGRQKYNDDIRPTIIPNTTPAVAALTYLLTTDNAPKKIT